MDWNEVILGLVALVLVVFSLVSALVIPRAYEGFPGPRLRLFVLVSVLLVAGMLAAVEVFGEAHESGEAHGKGGPETGITETAEAPTGTEPVRVEGNAEAGKDIFSAQGCGGCHAFEAAGSSGATGPNLDESLKGKDADYIRESIVEPDAKVAEGYQAGIMPKDYEKLPTDDIDDLVAFLAQAKKQ